MFHSKKLNTVTRIVLISVYASVNTPTAIIAPHEINALAAIEWDIRHGLALHSGAADNMAL
jgi:hypothetical protein